MNNFGKFAMAAALVGVTALASASPSEARNGRNAAAIGGFAAGAVVGAAVASSANNGSYGPGYYEPGYAYEPAYVDDGYYAYEPAPTYRMAPRYRVGNTYERTCGGNPGKSNYVPCGNN